MYFRNIKDKELSIFHDMIKLNRNWTLTEVLSSDLFRVEEIVADTIYRIYPLFYCDEIVSTNPDDKILDSQCIICEKKSDTRLFFNSAVHNDFDISIKETTLNGQKYIDFVCYSTTNGETIGIVDIRAEEWFDDTLLYATTYTTDYQSNYIHKLKNASADRVEFTFTNSMVTKTYTWEV